ACVRHRRETRGHHRLGLPGDHSRGHPRSLEKFANPRRCSRRGDRWRLLAGWPKTAAAAIVSRCTLEHGTGFHRNDETHPAGRLERSVAARTARRGYRSRMAAVSGLAESRWNKNLSGLSYLWIHEPL